MKIRFPQLLKAIAILVLFIESINTYGQVTYDLNYFGPQVNMTACGASIPMRMKIVNNSPTSLTADHTIGFNYTGLFFTGSVAFQGQGSITTTGLSGAPIADGDVERVLHFNLAPGDIAEVTFNVQSGCTLPFGGATTLTLTSPVKLYTVAGNRTVTNNLSYNITQGTYLTFYEATNLDGVIRNGDLVVRRFVIRNFNLQTYNGVVNFADHNLTSELTAQSVRFSYEDHSANPTTPPNPITIPVDNAIMNGNGIIQPVTVGPDIWLIIEETVRITGCVDNGNGASDPIVRWGCFDYDLLPPKAGLDANVLPGTATPYLTFLHDQANVNTDLSCFGTGPRTSSLTWRNNTAATANNVRLTMVTSDPVVVPVGTVRVFITRAGGSVEGPYTVDYLANNVTPDYMSVTGINKLYTQADLIAANPNFSRFSQAELDLIVSPTSTGVQANSIAFGVQQYSNRASQDFVMFNYFETLNSFSSVISGHPSSMNFSTAALASMLPQAGITGQGSSTDNVFLIKRLNITSLFDPSGIHVNQISLDPGDEIRIQWQDYSLCLWDGIPGPKEITSPNVYTDMWGECSRHYVGQGYEGRTGINPSTNNLYSYVYARASGSLIASVSNTQGNVDRCNETADGRVENLAFKIACPNLTASEGSPTGVLRFKLYLQDGLDFDRSFELPTTWGATQNLGYNNLTNAPTPCDRFNCDDPTSACHPAANPVSTSNRYNFSIVLRDGTIIPSSAINITRIAADRNVTTTADGMNPIIYNVYSNGANPITPVQATFEYSISINIADIMSAIPISQGRTYESLRIALDGARVLFDVRAYCPSSNHHGPSNWQMECQWIRCANFSETSCGSRTYSIGQAQLQVVENGVNALPLFNVNGGMIVNCPGCQIPGSEIVNYTLARTNVGLVDADLNGEPDPVGPGGTTLPIDINHPNRRIVTQGDVMESVLTISMPDGSDASDQYGDQEGCTKAQLDSRGYYLDNLYVQFANSGPNVEVVPGTVKAALVTGGTLTWVDINPADIINGGATGPLMVRIRASELGATHNGITMFHTDHTVTLKASFTVYQIGLTSQMFEFNYRAGFSGCDNCTDFGVPFPESPLLPAAAAPGQMYDANPAFKPEGTYTVIGLDLNGDPVTTTHSKQHFDFDQLAAAWPNAYLWCTNGGNVIRFVPYFSSTETDMSDQENGTSCIKVHTIKTSGVFYEEEVATPNYDAFPGEYRRFFGTNNPALSYQLPIPTGYEVYKIQAEYSHRQGIQYLENYKFNITDLNAIAGMVTPAAGNTLFNAKLNLMATLVPDEDNLLPPNLQQYIDPPLATFTTTTVTSLQIPLDEESFGFSASVYMRPIQCQGLTVVDLFSNWDTQYRPLSNLPTLDWHQQPKVLCFNPNVLTTLSAQPTNITNSPVSNTPSRKITPPAANLNAVPQGVLNLTTSANFIQVPVRIDCSTLGAASFPYFVVSGPALQKGLTLVGVYLGDRNISDANVNNFIYNHYMVSNNNAANPSWIVGIDHEYGPSSPTFDPNRLYYIGANTQQVYTLVFSYACGDCAPLSRCDRPNDNLNAERCLNEDDLFIGYGWNCNSYPTFANLANVCGSYEPKNYKVSTSKVGLTTNHYINGSLKESAEVTTLTSCSNFTYEVELTSCYKGQLDNFNVRFGLPPGVSIDNSVGASITLSNYFNLVPMPDGSYQITAKSTFGGLPVNDPSITNTISTLKLTVPMKVNCSFALGDIATNIAATTYCGTPVTMDPINRTIRTDYDLTQVDNINMSEIQVQVSPTSISVNYNITSAITHTNLLQITLPTGFVVSGTTDNSVSLTIPSSGTGSETINISSNITSCSGDYPVLVTIAGSYLATCSSSEEPCTKVVPLQTATYHIIITPFTVSLNNVGPCIPRGTTLTATTNASGTLAYQWYNGTTQISGATSATYVPSANGNYSVEVSNGNCTVASAGKQLNISPQLQVQLGNDLQASLFCGSVTLIATASDGTPAYTGGWYEWNSQNSQYNLVAAANYTPVTPATTPPTQVSTYTAQSGGMYQVTVTDQNNCTVTQTINTPDTALIIPPSPVCPGENPTLTFTNLGNVIGTYDVGWFNINLPLADRTLLTSITSEGDYQAAAVVPGCTLTTATYHISFKAAPVPFHITPDGFEFTCSNVSHIAHITNPNANDNGDGNYYNDGITYLWSNGATTLNDQTFTGVGGFSITAMNTTTGCVATSNSPSFDWPRLNISRNCTGVPGQVLLTASSNFTSGLYHWWYTDPNTFVKTEITSGLSGANNSNLTVTQTGIYSVTNANSGSCPNTEVFIYENLVVSATPNADLIDALNGRFDGITTCGDAKLFTSALLCLDRSSYPPNPGAIDPLTYGQALPNHYMINYGTALSANDWNPGYWQGSGYNSNTFMIVDGTPVQGDKVVWKMNVPVAMGHYHLFRAMTRTITTTAPPVPQEPPVVYLRVTYKDASGNPAGGGSQTQKILFNNTNQQWVELSGFSPTITQHSTNIIPLATNADLELYIADGTILGRDFALDNISFIPVGLCDNIQTILDNTGRNCGSVASVDFYQKSTCGGSITFNVFDLATDPGITYSWRNSATGSPVIATGKTFTITPSVTTSYTLKVENAAKGCFFEQQVKAIVLPAVNLIANSVDICSGNSVQLSASGANSYVWTPSAALTNPNSATPTTGVLTSNTTYTVTGTSLGGCSATKNVTVTVKPLPVVSISPATASVCVGTPLTLTASGANTFNWTPRSDMTTNGATATLTLLSDPANPTTTVTVTGILGGCSASATSTITRKELPNVTFTDATVCTSGFGDFNTQAADSYVYTWSPASGLSSTTSANPIVAGSPNSRTYSVTVYSPITTCSVVKSASVTTNYTCVSVAPVYDGVDDRTTVPYHPWYQLGTGDFTLEAWVKLSASQNYVQPTILSTSTGPGNGFMWAVDGSLSGGKRIVIRVLSTTYYSSTLPSTLFDDKCHHFAVTRTAAGALTFYIDGVASGTNTVTGSINTTNTIMTMGSETNGAQPLKGSINEIRIWRSARTASEISANLYVSFSPSTTNLIGYWRFKQMNTQYAVDESQVHNDGYFGTSVSTTTADPSLTGTSCGGAQILTVVTPTKVCAGMPVTVNYTTAAIPSGAQLYLFLSDANGVFGQGTPAFLTADGSGTGSYTFNAPTIVGTGYLVKMQYAATSNTVISAPFEVTNLCKGIEFDGNDVATIPHHNAYNIGMSSSFTLEAWVNMNTSGQSASPVILSKRTTTTDGFILALTNNGTQIQFVIGNISFTSNSFTSIYDGACHHIAARKSGSTVTLYLDGNPLNNATMLKAITGTGVLNVGLDYLGNGFKGKINEVRFWNTARTDSEILNNKTTVFTSGTAGLIGYWRFKELPGNQTITDESSTANHGVLGTTSAVESTVDPIKASVSCFTNDRFVADEQTDSSPSITYYPNPFDKVLNVLVQDFATEETTASLQIVNVNGVEVYNSKLILNVQNELHLDLPAGVYMAIIRYSNNTSYQHKVISIK